jgi:outer membrane usher protein
VINFEYDTSGIARGFSVRLSLTKRFGKTGSIRADYDSSQQLGQVTVQDSHGRGVGSWNGTATVQGGAAQAGFNGDFEYEANRGQLGIAQSTSYDVNGRQITDVRTTASFDTAIAFTGGHFAIGQPIFDSFAIFDPHPSLKGAQVAVDPSPDGVLSESGPLGPALLSDIGSYSVRTLTYDVPNAPTGYDIGSGALRVKSPYRAGYFVEVGSDYSMTVLGRVLDADGKPISLLAGHLIEQGQPKGKSVEFFTTRDGRFAASGLRPGRWTLDLPTDPESIVEIVIPKGDATLVRVGDLKAAPAKEQTR